MQTGILYTHRGMNSYGLGATGQIGGWLDSLTPSSIGGWAVDMGNTAVPIQVDFYIDGTLIQSAIANQSRPDLVSGVGIDANHGWSFIIPINYQNGQSHTFNVKTNGVDLSGSPRTEVTAASGAYGTTILTPGVMNQVPTGSPGTPATSSIMDTLSGISLTTWLLVGGGALVMFMMSGHKGR